MLGNRTITDTLSRSATNGRSTWASKDINLIQAGVSSAIGTFSVAQSAFDSGTNHITPLNPSEVSNTHIECFPIDNLQVPAKSLVKIDVEGHELEVLKGMSGLLKGKECIIIFEHWHNTPDAYNRSSSIFHRSDSGCIRSLPTRLQQS